jgi:hypothetical protein
MSRMDQSTRIPSSRQLIAVVALHTLIDRYQLSLSFHHGNKPKPALTPVLDVLEPGRGVGSGSVARFPPIDGVPPLAGRAFLSLPRLPAAEPCAPRLSRCGVPRALHGRPSARITHGSYPNEGNASCLVRSIPARMRSIASVGPHTRLGGPLSRSSP